MQKKSKQLVLLFSVLFPLILNLSACVPVVVVAVGAAASKTSMGDKTSDLSESQKTIDPPKAIEPSKAIEPPKTESVEQALESKTPEVISEKPAAHINPQQKEFKDIQELPKELVKIDSAQPVSQQHDEVVTEAYYLINQGWKVKLSEVEKNNMVNGVLYFDANGDYYGFDGCKNFKGKYELDAGNRLLIKTLIVSSKGANNCGNDIEQNLFFVNSFKLQGNELILRNNEKHVISLTHIDNFNAKAFLINAKIKYRAKITSRPKSK